MAIKCCMGCVAPKRHPGCHDHCPEYIKEKTEYNQEKAAAFRKRRIEEGLDSQTFKGVARINKKKKGCKRKWKMD